MNEITKKDLEIARREWVRHQRLATATKSDLDSLAQRYCVQEEAGLGMELDYEDLLIKEVSKG